MSLIKGPVNNRTSVSESSAGPSLVDIDRFHKKMKVIEDLCEQLESNLREGGRFRDLIDRLHGDKSYLNDAMKGLKMIQSSMEDLHMYTDIHLRRSDDE